MKKYTLFFLCDRKACGETCPNIDCNHTRSEEHAINKTNIFNVKKTDSEEQLWEILDDCHVKCKYIDNKEVENE